MQIILERDSIDKPLTFNICLLQLIFHTSVFTYYIFMRRCFQSSNSAEGLHFSAFHYYKCYSDVIIIHMRACMCTVCNGVVSRARRIYYVLLRWAARAEGKNTSGASRVLFREH